LRIAYDPGDTLGRTFMGCEDRTHGRPISFAAPSDVARSVESLSVSGGIRVHRRTELHP